MKYLFSFLLFVHGLIHLMGFAKGFGYGKLPALTKFISKPTAAIWLFAAVLFTAAAVLHVLKKENWPLFAVVAVVVSQLLIVWYWKDAKMGTVANLVILLITVPALGDWQFNRMYKEEVRHLLSQPVTSTATNITYDELKLLPVAVQNWLRACGIIDKPAITQVYLQQRGEMKSNPAADWIPFEAEQYFTANPPSFAWKTKINPSPFLYITGRDKYEEGNGNMLIKAYSLFTIANSKGPQTDQGTLVRYLAEICWFPSAAISEYIQWEAINDSTAKATMHYGAVTASGIFYFNANADLQKFEADRYYNNNNRSTLERWEVTCIHHQTINGIRIPVKNNVTWKLKEGDFKWLELEISNIQFTFTK
ncbi:MAG: DUF6544 family protein [Lacibacter sp.]